MIDKSIHNLFDSISDTGLLALVKINPARAKSLVLPHYKSGLCRNHRFCIIHRRLVLQSNIQNSFLFVSDSSALLTICLCRGEETEVSQDHTIFGCERNKTHVLLSGLLIQFSHFSILHLLKNQSMYADGHGFLCN